MTSSFRWDSDTHITIPLLTFLLVEVQLEVRLPAKNGTLAQHRPVISALQLGALGLGI